MNIRDKKDIIITCPFCGAEYLPSEIYIPSAFLGKPEDIDKSSSGKIEIYNGTNLNLKETYICDFCNKEFEVSADVKFKSQALERDTFNEVYTTPLHLNRISLFEGESDDIN